MIPRLLTKKEAAAQLRMSVRFVELQVQRRALAAVKLGRSIRFYPKDLEQFIKAHRLRAVNE